MDYTPIINQVMRVLWYLVPAFILIGVVKSSWFKGIIGELLVNLLLKIFLSNKDYHLIKNVTLATEDGTTQIDHIIVSKYGVFVIETKNMKGWIFGSANQKQWTQKIFKHSSRFQNPLHQNYKHIKTIENCLNIDSESIFSVVVFIGDSTFKTKVPNNVTNAVGSIRYIKSKKQQFFSKNQVLEITKEIESGRLRRGLKTNFKHVAHVKKIIESKKAEKTCKKCGSAMVLRESKKGVNAGKKFLGCSAFPKCRAVVNIT